VAPGPVNVKVAPVIVAGFIASLKVAASAELAATPVAPLAGTVAITVGAPVVNVHTKLAAKASPAGSWAPVVMVAVYTVEAASDAVGVKVAITPEEVTAPVTGTAPGAVSVKVFVLIVV
jgi:hypothetical protein